jgi:hypothetical protein
VVIVTARNIQGDTCTPAGYNWSNSNIFLDRDDFGSGDSVGWGVSLRTGVNGYGVGGSIDHTVCDLNDVQAEFKGKTYRTLAEEDRRPKLYKSRRQPTLDSSP